MNKKRLSDDDFLNVVREARAWKESDTQRFMAFQNRIKRTKRMTRIRLSIFALSSVAAIVLIMLYIPWKGGNTRESGDLYDQFYEQYRFASDYRSGSADFADDSFRQALKAYNEESWSTAEVISDSLTKSDNYNPDYLLLNALTKLANGSYDIAEQKFNLLIPIGGSYALHARWYLSLTYLKLNKIRECQNELKFLKQSGNPYYRDKALKLLQQLK